MSIERAFHGMVKFYDINGTNLPLPTHTEGDVQATASEVDVQPSSGEGGEVESKNEFFAAAAANYFRQIGLELNSREFFCAAQARAIHRMENAYWNGGVVVVGQGEESVSRLAQLELVETQLSRIGNPKRVASSALQAVSDAFSAHGSDQGIPPTTRRESANYSNEGGLIPR